MIAQSAHFAYNPENANRENELLLFVEYMVSFNTSDGFLEQTPEAVLALV